MRLLLVLLSLSIFCSPATSQDKCIDTSTAQQKYSVRDFPAVGRIDVGDGRCTAFLVDPEVAVTASHCINHTSSSMPTGIILDLAGKQYKVVKQFSAFNPELTAAGIPENYTDIALLVLDRPVIGITPLTLSRKYQRKNDMLAMVGYGCTGMCFHNEKAMVHGAGDKRISIFRGSSLKISSYTSDQVFACPGDSGAPIINLSTGEVIGVASSFAHTQFDGVWQLETSRFANTIPLAKVLSGER